jgi:hypothetical protein
MRLRARAYQAQLVAVAVMTVAAVYVYERFTDSKATQPAPATGNAPKEDAELRAKLAWYKWYFSEYAAALRLAQYGEPTLDINQLLATSGADFAPIGSVTASVVCPAPSNGAFTGDFIYWGARMLPLIGAKGVSFYAVSYLGSAGFAHSEQAFDALMPAASIRDAIRGRSRVRLGTAFGLAGRWLAEHSFKDFSFAVFGDYGHSALMSYNSSDVDGDGHGDFVFDRWLVLSSSGYASSGAAPRRAIFIDDRMVALEGEALTAYRWSGERSGLVRLTAVALRRPALADTPYALLPLPGGLAAVRTQDSIDIYELGEAGISFPSTITGVAPGEIQTGAFGDFDGDGQLDFWLSQVATPTPYPNKQDQLVLIRTVDIRSGPNELDQIRYFGIKGSPRYSDYDGISTTLSPIAGDVTADGRPDISFTGHRHMNESGALYLLPGDRIVRGEEIDVTAPQVVKILGKAMSQVAPPFHHWDATDLLGDGHADIVIPVDNDLCSGLNAGAIYVLSGKKITELAREGPGAASGAMATR